MCPVSAHLNAPKSPPQSSHQFLFAGLRMVYNVTNPPFSRVVSVDVLSTDPEKPMYKPLNDTKMYGIITQSFVVNGGDGFKMITENAQNHK